MAQIKLSLKWLQLLVTAVGFLLIALPFFTPQTNVYYFYAGIALIFGGNIILSIFAAVAGARVFASEVSQPGSGGVIGTLRNNLSGKTQVVELANWLGTMGVKASVVGSDNPDFVDHDVYVGGIFGNIPRNAVRLEGRNIDLAEMYTMPVQESGTPPIEIPRFIVKGEAAHMGDLRASLMPTYSGTTISPQVTGYKWVGQSASAYLGWRVNRGLFLMGLFFMGLPLMILALILASSHGVISPELYPFFAMITLFFAIGFAMSMGQWIAIRRRKAGSASLLSMMLNSDAELAMMIQRAFREAQISIDPSTEYGYVSILGYDRADIEPIPSQAAFEVYDRIAGHIKGIAPERHDLPGVSTAPVQSQASPFKMRTSYRNLGLLGRLSGGLFIIGVGIAATVVFYIAGGSDWLSLGSPLLVTGIFVAIGIAACIAGFRSWLREKGRRRS